MTKLGNFLSLNLTMALDVTYCSTLWNNHKTAIKHILDDSNFSFLWYKFWGFFWSQFHFSFLFFFIVVGFVIHWNETAMGLHVFPIPIPPPTSLSARSLWVFPVHRVRALVSCIQPGLVICFTLDNIHVSMLFSWNISPLPSPTESKRLFYTSVSLFLFWI